MLKEGVYNGVGTLQFCMDLIERGGKINVDDGADAFPPGIFYFLRQPRVDDVRGYT